MKRVAANRVLISADRLLLNAVVEIDDNDTVQQVFELDNCTSEPANTLFFNGLITTFVPKERRTIGQTIGTLVADELVAGYCGKLLLWQGLSSATFQITQHTKSTEI